MSNTTVPISEWCKEIRVALARKEMNLQSVADEIGYSYTTITALISGRIVKDNYLDIAKKINEVLEVNVLPEKPQLPSDEWCGAVRAKLYALTWVDCNLAIHIIVPEPENRSLWARYIADRLNMAGEVTMLDDSPMLIFEVSVENNADYLTRGQVMVKAQYSIPRIGEVEHPLSKIKVSQKEEK